MTRTILMLEHDEDDRYITQAVVDDLKAQVEISFVTTSTEMFQKLDKGDKPDLLLITLRASPLGAIEIVQKLKSSDNLRHIPVVVLSGTASRGVLRDCYDAGASSFIVKPASEKDTTDKISNFLNYWFKTVELP